LVTDGVAPAPPGVTKTAKMHDAPPLSIVLATTHPWPTLRATLASIEPEAAAVGAEIVVVDGDGAALPADPEGDGRTVWLRAPGCNVFELRAMGAAAAHGAVVAITEDHCLVAPDWCARMLQAHRDHPDVAVVAGCVLNGATERLIDRANFVLVHSPSLPPLPAPPARHWAPGPANMSFKRAVVPRPAAAPGHLELVLVSRLLAEGRVAVDDRIAVHHDQSNGFLGTFVDHFHAGRSVGGLVREASTPPQRRTLTRAITRFPRAMLERVRDVARDKPGAAMEVRRVLPLGVPLFACSWAGVAVGVLSGPGRSPHRLK
jgi:hypothetical protein